MWQCFTTCKHCQHYCTLVFLITESAYVNNFIPICIFFRTCCHDEVSIKPMFDRNFSFVLLNIILFLLYSLSRDVERSIMFHHSQHTDTDKQITVCFLSLLQNYYFLYLKMLQLILLSLTAFAVFIHIYSCNKSLMVLALIVSRLLFFNFWKLPHFAVQCSPAFRTTTINLLFYLSSVFYTQF